MKRTNYLFTGVCAAALAAVGAHAQNPPPSPYVTTTRMYIFPGYTHSRTARPV